MGLKKSRVELTPGQRSALSNHINLSILLYLLQRPATLEEIALEHQILPLEANLRLRKMSEEGLVSSTLRQSGNGTSERVYQAVMDDMELLHSGSASNDPARNAAHMQIILNQLKRDLIYHALHPDEGTVHVRMIGIRTTPEAFEAWIKQLREAERQFDEADDESLGEWYFMTVAMYPQPHRDRVKREE